MLPDNCLKIYKEQRRRRRKRKRRRGTMMTMTMMRMMTKHITRPKTTMMTARSTLSSGPPRKNLGMQIRKVTCK